MQPAAAAAFLRSDSFCAGIAASPLATSVSSSLPLKTPTTTTTTATMATTAMIAAEDQLHALLARRPGLGGLLGFLTLALLALFFLLATRHSARQVSGRRAV